MQAKSFRALLVGAALFSVAVLAPSQAHAQLQAQLDFNSDLSQLGAGLGYNFNLGNLTSKNGITAVGTFDYYLPKSNLYGYGSDLKRTYWEANVNGKMDIKSAKGLYVGAGLGYGSMGWSCSSGFAFCSYANWSGIHINALGGYNFATKKMGPFVEAGFNLGGSGTGGGLRLTGGIRF